MILKELLNGVKYSSYGSEMVEINDTSFDSRKVTKGSLFVAIAGTVCDGHTFIEGCIEQGAAAILCQQLPTETHEGVSYIVVEDSNAALGQVAANFYDNPSSKLKLVGITGTNGKTTTATLLYDLYRSLGYKVGLISTVVYKIDEREIKSTHTTPDAIRLNAMLSEMVEIGCEYCFMEVSSHSIAQERISALHFTGAIFSNITHDHLDYHKTFAEYIKVKKRLFDDLPREAFALTNMDDRNGEVMLQNCKSARRSYSLRGIGDYNCKIMEITLEGMLLKIDGNEVWVSLLGRFNAYNILALYATAMELGAESHEVLTALSTLHSVSGRFEYLRSDNGITAIVDYAHTPDALSNVMETIESLGVCNRLVVVVGCGGERDKTKRPEMAQIAVEGATRAIFTSDNPRSEDPEQIIRDMVAGVGSKNNYLCITDRRAAIRTAIMTAEPNDIVLIAGKGHESYQIIGTTKEHFNDREEVEALFKTL